MKRFLIFHGWAENPESHWIPWLKAQLLAKGFIAHAPQLPNPANPDMAEWISEISKVVGIPDNETYLVGRSLGCQAILRYLEGLGQGAVGGVLLVAPFITIRDEKMVGDAKRVLSPWVERKLDLSKAVSHSGSTVSIMSDNDPFIPISDAKAFESAGSKVIIIPKAGHFSKSDGYGELHAAFNELLKMK